MSRIDDYRRHAAACMRIAEQAADPGEKGFLLEMARAWYNLAAQAERNSKTDIVYETPPAPPAPQQPAAQQQQQIQPDEDESKS